MVKVTESQIIFSKQLRSTQTPWESKVWSHLRAGRFKNLKFKRQVPIGKYIVDFCCDEKRLVIELDGGQHSESQIEDAEKDNFFKSQGYMVLRIWNNDVNDNLEGVMEMIDRATSLPASPHAWGEG